MEQLRVVKPQRFIDKVRPQIDKIDTVIVNGKEHKVAVIYGEESWETVFARVIRGHYMD